jgi:dTDP-4-dehydrorhamnose reductase
VRILITGAGGQVGRELVDAFAASTVGDGHEVVGLDRAALDVVDGPAVVHAVADAAPDVIVHSAAWTAVDLCEGDPQRAEAINASGTRHVVRAAGTVGARVVYLSTDYVFDGTKDGPYVEDDATNPLSVYGRTKLGGELAMGPEDVIVRTSWVAGRHGANMVKTILRLAAEHDRLGFVEDQWGHPTFADDLAGAIVGLVEHGASGTFHITNQGATSWHGFAQAVLAAAGDDPSRVDAITTTQMPRPAPRPANGVLENQALAQAGLPLLPDFREPLARLVAELQDA